MAKSPDRVHAWGMRKTSDIIWQDAQHQVLFDILDAIKQPGADLAVLERLRDYAEHHFTLEERYMEDLGYPAREEHIESHDRFRHEIEELLQAGEPDPAFMDLVATFLSEWLKRHVFGVDKELEAFILGADAK
jgi:hemerythrin